LANTTIIKQRGYLGFIMKEIRIIGLTTIPIVRMGDDIAELILDALNRENVALCDGDVILIAQSIVSKAEGAIIDLQNVKVSPFARRIAERLNKDPRIVEVILQESNEIVRMGQGHIITETKHGFVCANSGVDRSNVGNKEKVTTLPKDPDLSAQRIREKIMKKTRKKIAVIITDTTGRPLRVGVIGSAIGVAGIDPLLDKRGSEDLFGYKLRATIIALADELASAAMLMMGEANERIPVVIIRGVNYKVDENASAKKLIMPREKDLFR